MNLNTDSLLKKILECPSEQNYTEMIKFISSGGFEDFISSIKKHNTLSLIFLKNYVEKWIEAGILQNFYTEDFLIFLIECYVEGAAAAKRSNLSHLCDFFEILSNRNLISENIIKILINIKAFPLIDAIFKKYTVQPRSNQLFIEIKRNIELFFPIFRDLLFNPDVVTIVEKEYRNINTTNIIHSSAKPRIEVDQEYLLSIFYSLTYQDIHPLFEDNIEYFFKVFFLLFDQNQEIINRIFDLFISKYPEITNFSLIILTLTRIDSLDGLIINTLTNAYGYSKCHPEAIVSFLRRNLEVEMDDDWISNTQNIIRGNDPQRGFVHKLIRLLNCKVDDFEGEAKLFVATVLKVRDCVDIAISIIQKDGIGDLYNQLLPRETISSSQPRETISSSQLMPREIVFTAFRYLITIEKYVPCNLSYLNTDIKYICMKYISNYIKSQDTFHRNSLFLNNNMEAINTTTDMLDINKITKQIEETLDEFSSELLFRVVKTNRRLLDENLYSFILRIFQNLVNIPHTSIRYLFDVFISASIRLKKYNLQLVETILNKEMIDLYNMCFLYVSILVKETDIKSSFIIHILSQNELWNSREVHAGMCFILISSVEKGLVTKFQAEKAVKFLDGYLKTVARYKLGIKEETSSMEEKYLINDEFDGNWFIENFINKKYTRLVTKKMMKDGRIDDHIKQAIVEKNVENIEYENILHSIIEHFDI